MELHLLCKVITVIWWDMKTALNKIATVQTGYSFRSRLASIDTGTLAVIQMKDLSDANLVKCDKLAKVDMELPKEHHLVKQGDIIFRSRGLTTSSAILTDDPGSAVLAAPLLRIRVTSNQVMPEYLNWYINQPPAQSYLTSCAEGTALKMISKQSLDQLEVDVPSLDRQRLIFELAQLAEEEQRIMLKLVDKKAQYFSSTLLKFAEGEPNK